MRLFRHRYVAVIIGRESGHRTRLSFVTFRQYQQAAEWCIRMNDAHNSRPDGSSLTFYDFERINPRAADLLPRSP